MSPELEELARRAVACNAWEWWRGPMMVHRRVGEWMLYGVKHGHDGDLLRVWHEGRTEWWPKAECLPDLDDRATIGCLEGLVSDAWAAPLAQVSPFLPPAPGFVWYHNRDDIAELRPQGPCKAAALVAALESAPAREVQR